MRSGFLRFVMDLALNAAIPLALYHTARQVFHASEFDALLLATIFPAAKGLFDLLVHREWNPVSMIVLLGLVVSITAGVVGGSPRILLLRESIFTGLLGLTCLVSLCFPRPLMFYFGYHFLVRGDPARRKRYETAWRLAEVRHASRTVTFVWGCAFITEFGIRLILVWELSPGAVLAISPVVLGGLTVACVVWTLRYVRVARKNALPKVNSLVDTE